MRSAKATSRFAREVEVISLWLSSALPPEFSDEKLFMATYGQDQRRLPIVQEITKSVELLKGKVEKWKAKGAAERAATAKASEEFARLVFEDIQRNVTALVNIEASFAVYSARACVHDAPRCRRPFTSPTSGGAFTRKRRVFGNFSRPPGRHVARMSYRRCRHASHFGLITSAGFFR
jgi:hypothetical protein